MASNVRFVDALKVGQYKGESGTSGTDFSGSFTGSFTGSGEGDFTGSFTGSFVGDGSGLTNLDSGSWDGIFTGSARITGSLDLTGSLDISGSTTLTGDVEFGGTNETTLRSVDGIKEIALNVSDTNDGNNPDNFLIGLSNTGQGTFYAKLLELGDGEGVENGTNLQIDSLNGQFLLQNGNVGIGTNSPTAKLEVQTGLIISSGSGASDLGFVLNRAGLNTYQLRHLDGGLTIFNETDSRKEMTFKGDGNVGIGTTTPNEKLTVGGNIIGDKLGVGPTPNLGLGTLVISQSADSKTEGLSIHQIGNGAKGYIFVTGSNLAIQAGFSGGSPIIMNPDGTGNVGIGNSSPSEELTVEGNISASGFIQSNQITGSTLAIGQDYNSLPNDPGYTGIISRFDGGVFFNIKEEALKTFGINHAAVGDNILQIDTDPNHFLLDPTGNVELKVGLGVVSPSASLDIVGNIQASSHITASGNISSSATGTNTLGGPLFIDAAADNIDLFRVRDTEAQNNFVVKIDANQHTEVDLERNSVSKVRLNSYHPQLFNNDYYNPAGGLILGSDFSTTRKSGYGLYVSAGPVSGSIFASSSIFTKSHITSSGNISASGSIQFGANDGTPTADLVGAMRYRSDSNNSFVDVVMQTDVATYEWVNIVTNTW